MDQLLGPQRPSQPRNACVPGRAPARCPAHMQAIHLAFFAPVRFALKPEVPPDFLGGKAPRKGFGAERHHVPNTLHATSQRPRQANAP